MIAPHEVPLASVPLEAGSGDIGAAAPTIPLAAAKDGSWVAFCQARNDTDGVPGLAVSSGYHGELTGDTMSPYLVRAGGLGTKIDRLVAISRGGLYVAFIRNGELVVFDSTRGTTSALPKADLRGLRSRGGPAALSFSADGTRAIYFRSAGEGTSIVIRELGTSIEREVVLAHGTPFMVAPDAVGPWARLDVVASDSDHDGILTLPEVRTNRQTEAACAGPAVSYSEFGFSGDRTTEMWLRLDTGELLESPSLIRPVVDGVLMRADDDAIFSGTQPIVPAACKGMVKAILPDPLRVVAMCKGTERELPVEFFGPGFHAKTSARLSPAFGTSTEVMDTPFFCSAYNGCIDARDGKVIELHGSTYRGRHYQAMYLEHDGGFALLDPARGSYTPFPGKTLQSLGEHHFAADNQLIELASGKVVGTFSQSPIFIDARGRALVSAPSTEATAIASGPLRWLAATTP